MLAKQLINIRKQKTRTYTAASQISAAGHSAKAMGANVKLAEAMGETAKTMGQMNKQMDPLKVAQTMKQFEEQNMSKYEGMDICGGSRWQIIFEEHTSRNTRTITDLSDCINQDDCCDESTDRCMKDENGKLWAGDLVKFLNNENL